MLTFLLLLGMGLAVAPSGKYGTKTPVQGSLQDGGCLICIEGVALIKPAVISSGLVDILFNKVEEICPSLPVKPKECKAVLDKAREEVKKVVEELDPAEVCRMMYDEPTN